MTREIRWLWKVTTIICKICATNEMWGKNMTRETKGGENKMRETKCYNMEINKLDCCALATSIKLYVHLFGNL